MSTHAVTPRRAAETVAAGTALLLSLPIIAACAALSALTYRASPFFVHERVGLGGRRFQLYKIRTLPPTTDRYADKYSLGESRIPKRMQWMRRLHLDELPQLAHVVMGQMSLVGPRPEMPVLHDSLPPQFAQLRTSVRPGLTCLWQISPHNQGLIGERSEYDRLYVDYCNPKLDLWILAQTARKMVTGRTIHLHQVPRSIVIERRVAPVETAAPAEVDATTTWRSSATPEPARSSV